MKINKEDFDKLYQDDITVKEYNRIIVLIDNRFGEVVLLIEPKMNQGYNWFVYGNYDPESKMDDGEFDLAEYSQEIPIGGRNCGLKKPYDLGIDNMSFIPTRWLWTDDESIIKEYNEEVEKSREKDVTKAEHSKLKSLERKRKKQEFKTLIESKLTKEELKYIKFK